MLPSRWHHGHSLLTGFAGGLMFLAYRVWLIVVLAYAAGLATAVVVRGLRRLVRAVQGRARVYGAPAPPAAWRGVQGRRPW